MALKKADTPTQKLDVSGAGRFVRTTNLANVILETTDTDANEGPVLDFYRNPGQAGADDDKLGVIQFRGLNDASEDTIFSTLDTRIVDASDGTEDGRTQLAVIKDGVLVNVLKMEVWT